MLNKPDVILTVPLIDGTFIEIQGSDLVAEVSEVLTEELHTLDNCLTDDEITLMGLLNAHYTSSYNLSSSEEILEKVERLKEIKDFMVSVLKIDNFMVKSEMIIKNKINMMNCNNSGGNGTFLGP